MAAWLKETTSVAGAWPTGVVSARTNVPEAGTLTARAFGANGRLGVEVIVPAEANVTVPPLVPSATLLRAGTLTADPAANAVVSVSVRAPVVVFERTPDPENATVLPAARAGSEPAEKEVVVPFSVTVPPTVDVSVPGVSELGIATAVVARTGTEPDAGSDETV